MSEQERPEGFEGTDEVEGHAFEAEEGEIMGDGDVELHSFETGEAQIEGEGGF